MKRIKGLKGWLDTGEYAVVNMTPKKIILKLKKGRKGTRKTLLLIIKDSSEYNKWLLTHSLTYLLTHLNTYLLSHLLTYSLTHLLTYSLTHLLTHLLTNSLPYLLTYSLTYSTHYKVQLSSCA
jgi:hypothetical protein